MKSLIAIFFIIGAVGILQAAVFPRRCRTPEQLGGVHSNFNPVRYMGPWFEIERYEQSFQVGMECVTASYTLFPNSSVDVFNRGYFPGRGFSTDIGMAVLSFPNETPLRAMLNVTFSPLRKLNNYIHFSKKFFIYLINYFLPIEPSVSNYWVLRTDYSNYAFVVSCFNNADGISSTEAYWLLSRTNTLTNRASAEELINRYMDRSKIRPTNQFLPA